VAGPGWRDPHSLETVGQAVGLLRLLDYEPLGFLLAGRIRGGLALQFPGCPFLRSRSQGTALEPPWRGVWGVIVRLWRNKWRRGAGIEVSFLRAKGDCTAGPVDRDVSVGYMNALL